MSENLLKEKTNYDRTPQQACPAFIAGVRDDTATDVQQQQHSAMEEHFARIIEAIGENLNREGLKNTPKRAAKAMQYLTEGYHKNLHDVVNGAIFESNMDEMVIVKNIELYSLCEHHLLPFI